jgi:hypothetical protein
MEREQPDIGDPDASEIDEQGRNLTQQKTDERGPDESPVDADWVTDEAD